MQRYYTTTKVSAGLRRSSLMGSNTRVLDETGRW